MIGTIKNIITAKFDKEVSLDCSEWSVVINNANNVLVPHLRSTVDYYVEYFDGENLSFVLYENNRAVGVFPLFIHKKEQNWKISGDGTNLIQPLFIANIPKKTKKRLQEKIIKIVKEIARKLGIKQVQLSDVGMNLSSWYLLWLKQARKSFLTHQLAIDLQLSINSIRLGFRKSYKPLVNKALKEWDIGVCENDIDDVFEEFRLLHLEVAGRETRSKESWNIQKEQIKNDEAFLVTVRGGDVLIGAGLFTYTKDMGSYSIGAYKREMFDKPIGHGVQMKAIEALKEKGCKTYHIGQKMTFLDENIPTEKELSISHFKEGFAGYVYAQPHLKVNLNE
jgi:FemAB family protein